MRYLKLYACFVRFAMAKTLEFRMDFFFRFVMDIAYYAVNLAFYETLFLHTAQLGGYSLGQARIFVGGFMVVDAITMTLFSNNIWWLPTYINRGDLDYYLVRPVSSLFFATLRDFSFTSFLNLICAAGILTWALLSYTEPLPVWRLPLFLLFLGLGALLHSMVYLLTVLPSFWLESATGLHGMFYNFARLMERPDGIYTGWVRRALVTILPFAVMASFPSRMLWEGFSWKLVTHFSLIVVGFAFIVLTVWHLGLRRYGSASS